MIAIVPQVAMLLFGELKEEGHMWLTVYCRLGWTFHC